MSEQAPEEGFPQLGPALSLGGIDPASQPIDEGRHCRHCGRHLVYWQAVYIHATPWDANGQRELYLHCRVQIADPANEDERGVDELNREAALTAWMGGPDVDWEHLSTADADTANAFRAGWREARA